MEKRLPLALLLSFLVLVTWRLLFPGPPPSDAARRAASAPAEQRAAPDGAVGAPAFEPQGTLVGAETEERRTLEFGVPGERGSFRAEFTNRGARLARLSIGNWFDVGDLEPDERLDRAHWVQLLTEIETEGGPTASFGLRTTPSSAALHGEPLDLALWSLRVLGDEAAPSGVEFEYAPGRGVRFVKRFRHVPDTYDFELDLELSNDGAAKPGPATFLLTPAACVPEESDDQFYQEPQGLAAGREAGEEELISDDVQPDPRAREDKRRGSYSVGSELAFAGVHNKYFAVLLRASDAASAATLRGAEWRRIQDLGFVRAQPTKASDAWRSLVTDVILGLEVPPAGQTKSWTYRVYCGPKAREELRAADPRFQELVDSDLGTFDGIARVLLAVLGFFERLTRNWGVAIILLTLSVRLMLFPVNRRSQTAMARYQKKMKRLQPKIEELKKKYEKDPTRQRQEQAKLMQEEGLPAARRLPAVFLQIPIFFGLFSALRTSFDLRQAHFFGWMNDLSLPDRLIPNIDFDTHLPFIGTIHHLNVLPPLMVVLWVMQQRMMPMPADEQARRMQKMMMWMPVMMGFFLYNYAAGLSLYMITQSAVGMLETGFIKKKWPIDDAEQAPKKRSGFMQKLAEAQKQQLEQQKKLTKQPSASSPEAQELRACEASYP